MRRLAILLVILCVVGVSDGAATAQIAPAPECFALRPFADVERGAWNAHRNAGAHGLGGKKIQALWRALDEATPDLSDNVSLFHGAQASEFEVRVRGETRRIPDGAEIQLRVAHRGDFEDAIRGHAELRQGRRVLHRIPLSFGVVPQHVAMSAVPPDVVANMDSLEDLRVRVRSKAGSPTGQDLSMVSQLEVLVCTRGP